LENKIPYDNAGEHAGADLRVCPGNTGENVENTGEHADSPLRRLNDSANPLRVHCQPSFDRLNPPVSNHAEDIKGLENCK